jgi:RNA polymerase sigma-70 factor (ECF subfamily)
VRPDAEPTCDADALVRQLRAGDIAALERVTRCYGARLADEGRRRCRSPEEAEDAVHEAAIAAVRLGAGFRGEGRVDRWLVRLVATACARMRRGLKRDPSLHQADFDVDLLSEEPDPETLAARARLAVAIGRALDALPARDRALVLLADAHGLTGPELAEVAGISPGAARTRLSRAHARLREALAADGLLAAGDAL